MREKKRAAPEGGPVIASGEDHWILLIFIIFMTMRS